MRFDVSYPGRLSGETSLPGDTELTLSTLALGSLTGVRVTAEGPSRSPDVAELCRCLSSWGSDISDTGNTISVKGAMPEGRVVIPRTCPDHPAFLISTAAVFSDRSVLFEDRGPEFGGLIVGLLPALRSLGYHGEPHDDGHGCVVLDRTQFDPGRTVPVRTPAHLETILAASIAAGKPVAVEYPGGTVSHVLRLAGLLGAEMTPPVEADPRESEIERRKARAAGLKPPDVSRISWRFSDTAIGIPGDIVVGAAVAAAASAIPESNIKINSMLWEQGRRGFLETLRRMKADVSWNPSRGRSFETADVDVRWSSREGVHLTETNAETFGAEIAVLGPLAAISRGETVLRRPPASGAGEWFPLLTAGLESLGAAVGEYSEGIVIKGGGELHGDLVDAGGCGPAALAFALAGLMASGTTSVFGYDRGTYPVGEFLSIIGRLSGTSPQSIPGLGR